MSEQLSPTRTAAFEARLKKRYAAERRFKAAGLGAILFSVAVLLFLLVTMTMNGIGGFTRTELEVPVDSSVFWSKTLIACCRGPSMPTEKVRRPG